METMQAMRQLPAYKSHKTVWALKIAEISQDERTQNGPTETGAMITPVEEGYAPFTVSADYMTKHKPQVGGYWVQYADGYQSWSPAEAFEEGYTRI